MNITDYTKRAERADKLSADLTDIKSYEERQETLALLKILALGNKQIDEGKYIPASEAIRQARNAYKANANL
ncbi:hypothetical protein RsTz2092_02460 [Deferribacterales bacterium RsTz2092]|nr:hypothetical protein AGMMS49941_11490 [Deferribacterales bacterium]